MFPDVFLPLNTVISLDAEADTDADMDEDADTAEEEKVDEDEDEEGGRSWRSSNSPKKWSSWWTTGDTFPSQLSTTPWSFRTPQNCFKLPDMFARTVSGCNPPNVLTAPSPWGYTLIFR